MNRRNHNLKLLIDLEAVTGLAAYGLSEEEILTKLETPPLSASMMEAVAKAIRKGRALGSAEIKKARYQAALDGKVSAQAHLLNALDDDNEADSDGDNRIEVVREIYQISDEENHD